MDYRRDIIVRGVYHEYEGTEFALIECPYCGKVHTHGYGDGHRVQHCGDYTNDWETSFRKRNWINREKAKGYYLKCEKNERERIRLLAKMALEAKKIKKSDIQKAIKILAQSL